MQLPAARESDFFGTRRLPPGVDANHVKIINDTAFRTRLIEAGIAEGLQSPKGPQKIPSIIRLYPNFDAPAKDAGRATRPAAEPARTAYGLPTVEELGALIGRITALEAAISEELLAQINADISRLKRQIGDLEGDEFESAFREIDRLLTARKAIAVQVREEAFRRVDADAGFGPRKYLRLISRERGG